MRCEEKIPNGKLVCIEVWPDGAQVARVKITGDFFLHPEESITLLEDSLRGMPLSAGEGEVGAKLGAALRDSQLIGVSIADLARMFRKAVGK
jgi:lipoate-protein ligase A